MRIGPSFILLPFVLSCAGAAESPVSSAAEPDVQDLVALFQPPEHTLDTSSFDLGTAGARPALGSGWSYDEGPFDDLAETFVWSLGTRSEIEFQLLQPRRGVLRIRCAPFTWPGAPEQRVRILVNGEVAGEVSLEPTMHTYSTTLDPSLLEPGANHLRFEYAYTARPDRYYQESTDRRDVALAVDRVDIEWETLPEGSVPRVYADRSALFLPWGQVVRFDVRTGSHSAFQLAETAVRGGGSGRLRLVLEADGLPPLRWSAPVPGKALRWVLPSYLPEVARLTMSVEPEGVDEGQGALIHRPTLVTNGDVGPLETVPRFQASRSANVLLYVVDTVRADHVGIYGYSRDTSPSFDAFARRGILFRDAVAQSPWTRASVASILTGLYPWHHYANASSEVLADSFVSLAEILGGEGYETAAFITNSNIAAEFGLDQGFSTYSLLEERRDGPPSAAELHRDALGWLRDRPRDRPFFLYLHAMDPHAPYDPPEEFERRFATRPIHPEASSDTLIMELYDGEREADDALRQSLVDLYDGEIAYWDRELGRLLASLEEMRLLDETVVLVVSDHGEEFEEHGGWQHSTSVHAEQVSVPMALHLPGGFGAGREVWGPVQHVDVVPTMLDLLGMRAPADAASFDGVSLLARIAGAGGAEAIALSALGFREGPITDGLTGPRFKVIRRWHGSQALPLQLYDRIADPREMLPAENSHPLTAGFLGGRLPDFQVPADELPRFEMDHETAAELRALGYLR